jgi:diguanylate cyclase (GGDEF)-like protein/PAS domain S-box-containing protein
MDFGDICMSKQNGEISELEYIDLTLSRRNYLLSLLAGGSLVIAIIVALSVWAIIQGKVSAHQDAEVATANLSRILADNLSNTIEKIDFGIRGVLDEYDAQNLSGRLNEKKLLETIARQDARNPNSVGFRIFGPDGNRRFAVSTVKSREANLSKRPDFIYLRDKPDAGLLVSPPVFGITAQQWIIVLGRRITNPDGSFGGTVYGPIPVKRLTKAFSSLDIGVKGVVGLYHTNKQLTARFPALPGSNDPTGKVVINDQLRKMIDSGLEEAVFNYTAAVDGVSRIASARKIQGQPYYILVGFAEDDYLAGWKRDRIKILIGCTITIGLVLLGMVVLYQRMSERRKAVAQLEKSEAFKHAILNSVATEIVVLDNEGVIQAVNESWRKFSIDNGIKRGKCAPKTGIGADYLTVCQTSADSGSDDALKVIKGIRSVLDGTLPLFNMEYSGDSPIEKRWFSMTVLPLGKHAKGGVVITHNDISPLKQAETNLRIAATAFESQVGVIVTDPAEVILRVNKAFTEITGYGSEEIIGQTPRLFKSGRHSAVFYRAMWDTIEAAGSWQGELWGRRKNGDIYPVWLTVTVVKDASGEVSHYVGTQFDISERKKAEEKITELAFFDQLTGLPNRTLLIDRLKQAITASSRSERNCALLFIDLDHFKTLNDTLGHDMGDELLKQVADRLRMCVRAGDTVSRLGGDEFLMVLDGLSKDDFTAAAQVERVGEKIVTSLNHNFILGNTPYLCTASIGVTLFVGKSLTFDDLLKQADLAMYKSKEAGRNCVRFFDSGMETTVLERAVLVADLLKAIHDKQFVLHFQSQVLDGGRLAGAEVLARWQHPVHGLLYPDKFIALAEETGLILPLGLWVLEAACTQLAQWADQKEMSGLTLAVNVSAHQFRQPDFVDQVLSVLNKTGADPQRLKIELTESLLVENVEDIILKMSALRENSVSFSLDDFGTGYSSLSYLKRLPLEQLKIDKTFVRDVLTDPNDAAIVRTIVALAHTLGLDVIAEGVETDAQQKFLTDNGCLTYQGYLFCRPLKLADFEKYVKDLEVPFITADIAG